MNNKIRFRRHNPVDNISNRILKRMPYDVPTFISDQLIIMLLDI